MNEELPFISTDFASSKRNSILPMKSSHKAAKSINWKKQLLLCLFFFSIGIWFLSEITLEDLHTFFLPTSLNYTKQERQSKTFFIQNNIESRKTESIVTQPFVPTTLNANGSICRHNFIPKKSINYRNKNKNVTEYILKKKTDLIIREKHHRNTLNGTKNYLVFEPGCHIPALDLYDPSISEALKEKEEPPNCGMAWNDVLVKSNLTHLYIDTVVQDKLNLTGNLSCCVRPFWRPKYNDRTEFKYYKKCYPFKKHISITKVEFVRVECNDGMFIIYKDFYSFVPSSFVNKAHPLNPSKNVSVLILGLDALSRMNFERQMKRMHNFLTNQIKAIEFFGFHKVGDNTFPNLVPLLTGKSVKELEGSCWPTNEVPFDNCSFIWKDFKRAGYTTGFGEDASWMGVFEYCKMGFRKKPTDIYLKPFNLVYEKELGHDKRLNTDLCIGPKMNIEVLLDSVSKFVMRLQNKLSFGFFWENSLSHDYLNLPHYGDEIHEKLLKDFLKNGIFNQSVVIIMSDHGLRWGNIRKTYQGYIEERLPLLIISTPEWFKQRFQLAWDNLNENSRHLTTPFDLYETLKDLIDLSNLADKNIILRNKMLLQRHKEKIPRGISLFLQIPGERGCNNAEISDHWCTCNNDVSFPINSSCITKSASFIVNQINVMLKDYKQCSKLSLNSIVSARYKFITPTINKKTPKPEEKTKVYTIMLEAYPGRGLFEGTVQHHSRTDKLQLMGSISRSNTYGNSSYCITNCELKLYCYCIIQLKS